MKPMMGVIGAAAIVAALLPWIQPGLFDFLDPRTTGLMHGGWLMVIMGAVYLVATFDTVSWQTLAAASGLGVVSIIVGFTDMTEWPMGVGLIFAILTVLASLFVVWKLRPQTSPSIQQTTEVLDD